MANANDKVADKVAVDEVKTMDNKEVESLPQPTYTEEEKALLSDYSEKQMEAGKNIVLPVTRGDPDPLADMQDGVKWEASPVATNIGNPPSRPNLSSEVMDLMHQGAAGAVADEAKDADTKALAAGDANGKKK